ncbi:MAG: hypothetical protein JO215_11375 [Ktedonobacteraceae bacterium]|nr:hypothetical protein [Ktedonobacteraceae bacterium]MBV9616785.1 hypothetical protein [Ktedonobacteraceae bacterium]MBV9709551.1 hypothetical protein [Ktedonobacteraceae bacterium]
MAKPWDDAMKRLVRENPQHFVGWLLKGAQFKDFLSIELKSWTIEADTLLCVVLADGKELLLHIEFQSTDDTNMAQRLLEYNVLATREHKKNVYSCVIYLRKANNVPESPLIWTTPDGYEILRFHFVVIKLWELSAEDIMEMGLIGLLPLIPLTKNGKEYTTTEKMIEAIVVEQPGLLEWAKIFAGLVFKDKADHEWLERKFAMYNDIISESWVIQEAVQKGKLEGLRIGILTFIQSNFPELVDLTKKQIDSVTDPALLEILLTQVNSAKSTQDILRALIDINQKLEEKREENSPD